MKKFLEVSFIDLMSLEPLDSKRRPLRLHENIQDIKNWEINFGEDTLHLFEKIRKFSKKINFQKMVREFKGVWDKDMIREENAQRQIYSHAVVSLETWENYCKYLENLAGKVEQIRLDFQLKKYKLIEKFQSKFQGYHDFGNILKKLTMKTHDDDYFHLHNMKKFLEESQSRSFNH